MAGPLTWELAEDLGRKIGQVMLFTGHPDTLAKESSDRVQIVAATPYSRDGLCRRLTSWLRYLWQALRWLGKQGDTPILLFSNPPMLPWLGYLRRFLRGQAYAVMVHDLYPEVIVYSGLLSNRHLLVRLWHWLNRQVYRHAAVVMTLGEFMAAKLVPVINPPLSLEVPLAVIHPWADTAIIRPLPKEENWFAREFGQTGKLSVMYSGNMGLGHDLETILQVADQLRDEPDIHFMFIGAGPKWKLVAEVKTLKQLPNVTLLPWQSEEVVPYSLSCADVFLVSLEAGAEGLAFPSKSITAMAAGAAILGISIPPNDLEWLIHRHQCGVNVHPGDSAGLAQAIIRFRDAPRFLEGCRLRSRQAAEQVYSREGKVQELLGAIAPILSPAAETWGHSRVGQARAGSSPRVPQTGP